MKPNFALSLSVEGICLLHRSGSGWSMIGEIALDVPDLANQLAILRKTGLALDPQGLRTKLLIPNDQIKYLSLDTTRAAEDDILHALDGATPYSVSDLVYDFVRGGGRTYIAAVARETLAEAEAFAVEHRFGPVCFAAVPEPFTYMGEVFFGPTQIAASLIGPGQSVERDDSAVAHLPKPRKPDVQPPAETAVVAPLVLEEQPAVTESPTNVGDLSLVPDPVEIEDIDDSDLDAAAAAQFAMQLQPDVAALTAALEMAKVTDDVAPATQTPNAAAPDAPAIPSDPAISADTNEATAEIVAPAALPAPAPVVPLDPPEIAVVAETATLVPEAVFASRSRTLRAEADVMPPVMRPLAAPDGIRAPRADDDKNAPVFSRRTEPPLTKTVVPRLVMPEVKAQDLAETTRSDPPPSPMAALKPTQPGDLVFTRPNPAPTAAPVITGYAGNVRADMTGAAPVVTVRNAQGLNAPETVTLAPAKSPLTAPAMPAGPQTEPDQMGSFASRSRSASTTPPPPLREQAKVGGKPRYLGLLLTLILLACLAAVAAWAAYSTDNVVARWLGWTDETVMTAATPEVDPAATEPPAPDFTAPAVETATLPVQPPDNATASLAAPSLTEPTSADVAPADVAPLPAPEAVAPDVTAPANATGTLISPAEADRIYAATGVWLRAPRLPLIPTTEAITGIARADIDTGATKLALPTLPALANAAPDLPILPQLNPPAPGTVFARDARGFVLATPEGTVTPDGILVFAGLPAIIPPNRPGTPEPVVPETIALAAPRIIATSAPPLAPRPFANAPAPLTDPVPDPAIDAAGVGGIDLTSLDPGASVGAVLVPGAVPLLRPALRPAGLAPENLTPATPIETPIVAFAGTRPLLRPIGLTPLTTAAAAPEVLTAPTDPSLAVEDTVAAILAAAPPDPTLSATALAVASARMPELRPQNFADVVASAQQSAAPPAESQAQDASLAVIEPQPEEAPVAPETIEPSGPVSGDVATAATLEEAIDLREINLLGVFGQPNDRRALVRLANGRTVQVEVGDTLDGGEVAAIGDNALNYVKRGRTITLAIPNG